MAPATSLAPRSACIHRTDHLDGRTIALDASDALDDIEVEGVLALARPRLLRIARLAGVAPEHCDDIAQDTLLTAWRSLAQLRDQARLDAWLDGICRNLCQHYRRSRARERNHLLPLVELTKAPDVAETTLDLPDTTKLDPLIELERADQERLLEQALSRLSAQAREALELCYLVELPQREAAERLGLSVSALEARLHRARRNLRRVLETELRDEAEGLGWFPAGIPSGRWREARHWCYFCGKRRLVGIFLPLPNGNLELRMRCPACCGPDEAFLNSGDALQVRQAHAFGPAIKRLFQFAQQHFVVPLQRDAGQCCAGCGQAIRVLVRQYAELPLEVVPVVREHYSVTYTCPSCGILADASAAVALMRDPTLAGFIAGRPRYVIEPEREVEHQGRQALHFRFADSASTARMHIFADRHSLRILDTALE